MELEGKLDVVRVDLQPSEQYKSVRVVQPRYFTAICTTKKQMVLAGQRPEVIMEICTRAVSFWTYQVMPLNDF